MRWEWYWVVRREDVQEVCHPENSPSGLCFRQQDLCPGTRSQWVHTCVCMSLSWLMTLASALLTQVIERHILKREKKKNTAWPRQLGNRNGSFRQQRSGHRVQLMLHSKVINNHKQKERYLSCSETDFERMCRHFLIQSSSFFTPCPSCAGWPIGSRARTDEEDAEPERVKLQQATSSQNGQVHVCQNQDAGHWCVWWSVSYT